MVQRIENIGERGARRRMRGGLVWLAIALGASAWLLAAGAPRWSRLLLVVPFALAANGVLQAREKT